jgi:hypothetical protein
MYTVHYQKTDVLQVSVFKMSIYFNTSDVPIGGSTVNEANKCMTILQCVRSNICKDTHG